MKKKRFVVIFLLFMFLASMEIGIFIESVTHNWLDTMQYTKIGNIGITFLLLFLPLATIIIFLIRLTAFIKKHNNIKDLRFDCIFAFIGTAIGIFLSPYNPTTYLGAMIASFLIDYFDWMQYMF